MKICRNKRLNEEIHILEVSERYWMSMRQKAENDIARDVATQNLQEKRTKLRRVRRLKNK